MKRALIIIATISIGVSFISFILLFVPGFVNFFSKSTTYIGGHSSSSSGSSVAGTIMEASSFMMVSFVLLVLVSILMGILTIVGASKGSYPSVFIGIDAFCRLALLLFAFVFLPIAGSNSNTQGQAGAWKSSGTGCSIGGVGIFFAILQVIVFIFCIVAIVRIHKVETDNV